METKKLKLMLYDSFAMKIFRKSKIAIHFTDTFTFGIVKTNKKLHSMSSVLLILTILTIIEVQHLIESKEIATRIMGGNIAQLGIFPYQV